MKRIFIILGGILCSCILLMVLFYKMSRNNLTGMALYSERAFLRGELSRQVECTPLVGTAYYGEINERFEHNNIIYYTLITEQGGDNIWQYNTEEKKNKLLYATDKDNRLSLLSANEKYILIRLEDKLFAVNKITHMRMPLLSLAGATSICIGEHSVWYIKNEKIYCYDLMSGNAKEMKNIHAYIMILVGDSVFYSDTDNACHLSEYIISEDRIIKHDTKAVMEFYKEGHIFYASQPNNQKIKIWEES